MTRLSQLSEAQQSTQAKMIQELTNVRQDVQEMKDLLSRIRVQPQRRRRGLLFGGRRRSIPVQVESIQSKPAISLEQLLPLLPQLGSVIPQLKNPKVAEGVKILSNPAIVGMIQQFLANGGLKGSSTVTPVSSRGRRLLR